MRGLAHLHEAARVELSATPAGHGPSVTTSRVLRWASSAKAIPVCVTCRKSLPYLGNYEVGARRVTSGSCAETPRGGVSVPPSSRASRNVQGLSHGVHRCTRWLNLTSWKAGLRCGGCQDGSLSRKPIAVHRLEFLRHHPLFDQQQQSNDADLVHFEVDEVRSWCGEVQAFVDAVAVPIQQAV